MINRLAVLCALAAVVASCGSTTTTTTVTVTTQPAPTTTTTTTPVSPASMSVTVYDVVDGSIFPRVVRVPRTQAVARAALGAAGFAADVSVADGTATVDLAKATQDEQAEIVYTLT